MTARTWSTPEVAALVGAAPGTCTERMFPHVAPQRVGRPDGGCLTWTDQDAATALVWAILSPGETGRPRPTWHRHLAEVAGGLIADGARCWIAHWPDPDDPGRCVSATCGITTVGLALTDAPTVAGVLFLDRLADRMDAAKPTAVPA